jgi:hypothetical protein
MTSPFITPCWGGVDPLPGYALWEERIGYDLGGLASVHDIIGPEVRPVLCIARLRLARLRVDPTARQTCHHAERVQLLDRDIEGAARRHISKGMCGRIAR